MVRLEENKGYTEKSAIEKLAPGEKVYIPLSQHLGKTCQAQVKPGEHVLLGQKIGSIEAKLSALIHSSVSGEVLSIEDHPHPVLGKCRAIVIKNDGLDKTESFISRNKTGVDKLSAGELREIIFNAGIVGMGGASFPTHIKLFPPKPVDTLIINAAECEPYLTGDFRLMVEKTQEIIEGAGIVGRCLEAKRIVVAIEDNKPEAIEIFKAKLFGRDKFEVKVLKSQYPQGGEKQLIQSVLKKAVPRGKLPFDVGAGVQNVATAFAIYEAVYLGKPLYERVVTVTGSCLTKPKNLLVRIGTPIKELIEACGPLKENPAKIISGGPMMGIAQFTDRVPVIKSTTGIVLLAKNEAKDFKEDVCIRCGACVRACPLGLMPTFMNLASQKEMWQEAKFYGAADCMECGLCSYSCPSKIKIIQAIRRAKMELLK